MEVFLIAGMNAMPADVGKIADLARKIGPDRIQLNTAVRPPAEDFATALPKDRMLSLCHRFRPAAEVIAEFKVGHNDQILASQATIFSMLQRRPCTAEQIADLFGMHLNEVSKYLGKLMRAGQIRAQRKQDAVYYAATEWEEQEK